MIFIFMVNKVSKIYEKRRHIKLETMYVNKTIKKGISCATPFDTSIASQE